jgi:hypothetical protein
MPGAEDGWAISNFNVLSRERQAQVLEFDYMVDYFRRF